VVFSADESEWPIVKLTIEGYFTPTDMREYFELADRLVGGDRRYAMVYDARNLKTPDAAFVRKQAQWTKANLEGMGRMNLGMAFVINNAMVRGFLRAVLYWQRLPVPHSVHDNLDSGLEWARERCELVKPPGAGA